MPYAIIDFDAAAPGSRVGDLSYAAWMWLDIGNSEIAPHEQKRRMRLFCAAYGLPFDALFIQAMLQRQTQLIEDEKKRSNRGMSVWAKGCYAWTKKHLAGGGK